MKKMPKSASLIFKCIISCVFFSILLSFVQGNELLTVFTNINWPFFILSFVVTVIMLLASCAKWKVILDLKSKGLSYFELLKIYLVGYFFSNILPSTVGGDVVRSYYAGRLIENQAYSAVSVFVERFSGIFFLFLLVAFTPLLHFDLYSSPYIFLPSSAGLAFAGITLWVWKARNPFRIPNACAHFIFRILNRVALKLQSTIIEKAAHFLEQLYGKTIERLQHLKQELNIAVDGIKNNPQFLWKLIYLTILFYILTWVNVYTAFRAFNVHVDFIVICAIVPAVMLVAHVPVTLLGNLGYFESVFVFYFLLVGVGGAETLAMGLLLRLKMFSMGIVGFITYLSYKQKHQLKLETEEETQ